MLYLSGRIFLYNLYLTHLFFTVGFFGLFNFIGHVILSEQVALSIGWESNGFQKELGLVSLGIGICGILCYWFRDGLWIATTIPFSVFLLGAAIFHIKEMIFESNFNSGNVVIIIPDVIMPVTLFVLQWILKRRHDKTVNGHADPSTALRDPASLRSANLGLFAWTCLLAVRGWAKAFFLIPRYNRKGPGEIQGLFCSSAGEIMRLPFSLQGL